MLSLLRSPVVALSLLLVLMGSATGGYFYGRADGKRVVQAKWDAEYIEMSKQVYERDLAINKLVDAYELVDWRLKHEYEPKLAALRANNDGLSKRLREAYAARVTDTGVPAEAGAPTGADGAGGNGVSASVFFDALGNLIGACQRDAFRLNWFIARERALQAVESQGQIWMEVE